MTDSASEPTNDRPPETPESGSGTARPARRRRWLRRGLLVLGPVAVIAVAGYVYLTGGRFVETDNAYVKADKVSIVPEVSGPVVDVAVRENQPVTAGETLFRVDGRPYRIALEQAEAHLASVRDEIAGIKASYRRTAEELELARTNVAYAEREFDRKSALSKSHVIAASALDTARTDLEIARRRLRVTAQDLAQTRAKLQGEPDIAVEDHPLYQEAVAARDRARLDLDRATVVAPFDGIAGHVPQLGERVGPGQAAMSVVSDSRIWIDANFKETDLTYVHPGQEVSIRVDTYPDREWRGTVDSISPSTGAEFSVIPAQNATGNWVKVVQRIPVRVSVAADRQERRLRAGMSATVEIDTGRARELPPAVRSALAAVLGVFPVNAKEVEPAK